MPDASHVSPCCGAECYTQGGTTRYWACSRCGEACDPMDADLRKRIVHEGMERAAKLACRWCDAGIAVVPPDPKTPGSDWRHERSGNPLFPAHRCMAADIRAAMEEH